jgi:hypothetical protein
MADKDSTIPKVEFQWNEPPYSYLFIDKMKFDFSPSEINIKWTWLYNNKKEYIERYFYLPWEEFLDNDGNFQIWESPILWSDIKELGEWEVKVSWKVKKDEGWTGSHNRTTSFLVTLEPISSILFITGGATLVLRSYWKKKRQKLRNI